MTSAPHARNLAKLLKANAHRTNLWDVFRDFLELAALSLANAIDLAQAQPRERRYMDIIGRYDPQDQKRFPEMFALLVLQLEAERGDVMGALLGELELGNAARGQFFTPYHLCKMMAAMQVGDGARIREEIARKGFITLQEPAVGGGAMVIAFAECMQEAGIDYQRHLHVTAQDVDSRAVHMAFVQFALLGIPATVILGNTLALEEREHWHTPAHFLGLWDNKLRRGYALGSTLDGNDRAAPTSEPLPVEVPEAQGDLFAALAVAA